LIRVGGLGELECVIEMLVGIEKAPTLAAPRAVVAHAVPNLGAATALGVSVCGLPAEVLSLDRDLTWADPGVPRCIDCQEQAAEA
jgi:hypothetical protein